MRQKVSPSKQNMLGRMVLLVFLVLLVVTALLRILHGDAVKRLLELAGLREEESISTDFSYPGGLGEYFDLAGENLAMVSSAGWQLLDAQGNVLAAETMTMERPAVSAAEKYSIFYNVGGLTLRVVDSEGRVSDLSQPYPILSADVSEDGYVTVVTEYPDYKGRVMVYSPQLTALFAYDCGEAGYPLCARFSPDRVLVVNCVSSHGSTLHFFRLDREKELASFSTENELLLDFDFLTDGTVAAVSESHLLFLDSGGAFRGSSGFDGKYLADYALNGDFAAVLLHNNRSGNVGALRSIASDGGLLSSLAVERGVTGLSAAGDRLLVQYAGESTLYDSRLREEVTCQHVLTIQRALLRGDDCAFLLGNYGARFIKFN